MALPVSRLVRVGINLSPLAAATRSFGVLNIAGDSDVINGVERMRTYQTIDGVIADFGTTAPETLGAELYFGQTPKPSTLMISRWFRTAASALNLGKILTASQQTITNWTSITSGGFKITIDGVLKSLTGLDFSAAANLNAVAGIIDAALSGGGCIWNGTEFVISSDTTGAGVKASGTISVDTNVSYGAQATNTILLTGLPSPGDTVTVDGTLITFVGSSPGAFQVLIAGTAALTAANLLAFLQASADANIALSTYSLIGATITATARLYSTAGNSYTLAKSGANITIGGGTFSGGVNPDTLTVNGFAFTFVPANGDTSHIVVGPTASITAANINTALNASVDAGVAAATYSVSDTLITATYKVTGTAGNAFTIAKSSSHLTVSSTLSGGVVASSVSYAIAPVSGTDISTQLGLTSATSIALIPGFDAETPVDCVATLANKSAAWYGMTFAASVMPSDDDDVEVATLIEAFDLTRIFGVTITDTSVLSSIVTSDLASVFKASGFKQSFVQYSDNAYAICSFFGRAFSVNFNGNRSTITLMYKQEPSVIPQDLTTTQADVLKAKRCNVFVSYVNNTAIIQYGTMSGPAWFDEIHGLDWFQDAVQTAVYNLFYTSLTKIPQTDAGANQIVNAIAGVCDQAVTNGLVAPGTWNSDGFGQLAQGQFLKEGYYIYAQPIALQSQSDRDARVSPPVTVALKLAGAIQEVDVLVNVNR